MKLSEIPTLSTEKLIEIAEHYEAKAKQYSARVLIAECEGVAKVCRDELAKRTPADTHKWLKLVDSLSLSEAKHFVAKVEREDAKLRAMGGVGNNSAVEIRKSFEGPHKTEYAVWVVRTYTL